MPQPQSTADLLDRLAGELQTLALDYREPSRSIVRAERMIAQAEDISRRVRNAVRGQGGMQAVKRG